MDKKKFLLLALFFACLWPLACIDGLVAKLTATTAVRDEAVLEAGEATEEVAEEAEEPGALQTFSDGFVVATLNEKAGTLTFSGTGIVQNTRTWLNENLSEESRNRVRKIIFEPGITTVSEYEFQWAPYGFAFKYLKEIVFQGDVDAIGKCAFEHAGYLRAIRFEGGCSSIGFHAFGYCSALCEADVPEGCIADAWAFHCTHLER